MADETGEGVLLLIGAAALYGVLWLQNALGVTMEQLFHLIELSLLAGIGYGAVVGGGVWWKTTSREGLIAGVITAVATVWAGWFVWDNTGLSMELSYAVGGIMAIAGLIGLVLAIVLVAVWWDDRQQGKSKSRRRTSTNSDRERVREAEKGLNRRQRQRERERRYQQQNQNQSRYQGHVPRTTSEVGRQYRNPGRNER